MNADLVNALALGIALSAATLGAAWPDGEPVTRRAPVLAVPTPDPDATELADARGVVVPVAPYAQVISLHPVGDHLLRELLEPERLVAYTGYTHDQHPEAWRFGDRATVGASRDIEAILALKPDLVVTSNFAEEAWMQRLRDAGIQVFDLGEARGVATTLAGVRALGVLLAVQTRAARLEARIRRETAALEKALPEDRPKGIYLTVFGDSFFGGSAGTSYADLLHYGGVIDLAAEQGYREWPKFTPEQLLALDPSLIVTQGGMAGVICGHSILRDLAACGPEGRIIELSEGYHGDPGLGVIEAAATVQGLLFPSPTETAG